MNYYTIGLYLTVNWHDGGVYCSFVLCSLSKINYLNKSYIGVLYNELIVVPFIIFDRKRINLTVINSLLGNCNTFGYSISETRNFAGGKPLRNTNKRSAGQMCSWTQKSFTVDHA